jgi:hypothetical protein
MPTIHFNGKTYNDLAEMPAAERQMYDQVMSALRDEDGNGLPDILEGDVIGNIIAMTKKSGSAYEEQVAALEKISPEVRARISNGITKLNELGLLSRIQDLAQDSGAATAGTMPTWEDTEIRASKPVIPAQPAIQEDSGPRGVLLVGILAAIAIFLAFLAFLLLSSRGV